MRVLLISPLDPKVPTQLKLLMGGENTYTHMLLAHPPKGVVYVHFQDALDKKIISYHWSYYILLYLQKCRLLPPGPRVLAFHTTVTFDRIYAHAHPIRYEKKQPPIIISDSSSNRVFLQYYLKWPQWRLVLAQYMKQFWFGLFGIVDGEVNTSHANRIFTFSHWARRIKRSTFGLKKIQVIYPGLSAPKAVIRKKHSKIRILFVGVWFERKGGRIILEVFRALAKKYKNIHLTILGELPSDIHIAPEEPITHKDFVPYEELRSCYRFHDILVHIPPEIEGYGMAVPEAMSYGMCVIVSDICALPEFVEHRKSGIVIARNSKRALAVALVNLFKNRKLIHIYGRNAKKRFTEKFSAEKFNLELKQLYRS